jgi:hypothetical protein
MTTLTPCSRPFTGFRSSLVVARGVAEARAGPHVKRQPGIATSRRERIAETVVRLELRRRRVEQPKEVVHLSAGVTIEVICDPPRVLTSVRHQRRSPSGGRNAPSARQSGAHGWNVASYATPARVAILRGRGTARR